MKKKTLFWISLLFTLTLFAALMTVDKPLRNDAVPHGIVSFELAKSLDNSLKMINSWDAEAKVYAALSLGIDYLYMVAYGSFLALAVLLLAKKLPAGFLKKAAGTMVIFILLGAVLDGIENYGLIQLLVDVPTQSMVSVAYYCASIKFGLIAVGAVYLLVGLIVLGMQKRVS